jgi:hypothetical protein
MAKATVAKTRRLRDGAAESSRTSPPLPPCNLNRCGNAPGDSPLLTPQLLSGNPL